MKSFVCVVLLAAAALAAPAEEAKRDKRGFLHHGISLGYEDHGYSSFGHGYELEHAPIIHHAPVHKVVSYKKVIEVPKVIEVKKVVSVPKIISVPQIVKVHKVVEEPHHHHISYSAPSISHGHGWW